MVAAGFGDGEAELELEAEGEGELEGGAVPEGVGVGVDEAPGGAHTVSLVAEQPAAVTGQMLHATQPPAAALVPVELHVEPATQAGAPALEGDGVGVDEAPSGAHTVSLVAEQPAAVTGQMLHATQPPAAALVPVELHVEPATQACAPPHTGADVLPAHAHKAGHAVHAIMFVVMFIERKLPAGQPQTVPDAESKKPAAQAQPTGCADPPAHVQPIGGAPAVPGPFGHVRHM